ncbi:MAG: hypothetical protein ACK4SN_08515 [Bellilinea sp.]
MKPLIWIDAHQDIAYNALTFGRDIRLSAYETRRREAGSSTALVNGEALCGWEEYQRGGIGLILATLFVMPRRYKTGAWEKLDFATFEEAYRLTRVQFDFYLNLCDQSPDQFLPESHPRGAALAFRPLASRTAAVSAANAAGWLGVEYGRSRRRPRSARVGRVVAGGIAPDWAGLGGNALLRRDVRGGRLYF